MAEASTRFHEFGRFRVDTAARQVRCDGKVVPLEPKLFDILVLLLESSGRVVPREEIERLWELKQVPAYSLNHAISQLRKALRKALGGTNAENIPHLRTVHGRGYQFLPDVELTAEEAGLGSPVDHRGERILLRNTPELLKPDRAKSMVVAHDFYHLDWNPQGQGISHRYDSRLCGSARVVVDHTTGLMWEYGSSGFLRGGFQAAVGHVGKLNANSFAGFRDWRLPTLEEAMCLMTPAEHGETPEKAFHLDPVFKRSEKFYIWTSDVVDEDAEYGWLVVYWRGTCSAWVSVYNAYAKAVRCDVGDY